MRSRYRHRLELAGEHRPASLLAIVDHSVLQVRRGTESPTLFEARGHLRGCAIGPPSDHPFLVTASL
jgi:hypothetical protein